MAAKHKRNTLDISGPETHKPTFKSLTAEYFDNKHKDMQEVPTPIVTYTEYSNGAVTVVPGRVIEPETNEETLALVAEVAERAPCAETVSWFHIEGRGPSRLTHQPTVEPFFLNSSDASFIHS